MRFPEGVGKGWPKLTWQHTIPRMNDSSHTLNISGFRLAKEGVLPIAALLALTLLSFFFCWWIAGAIAVLLGLTINFFRDPERSLPEGDHLFISPADGKVIRVDVSDEGLRIDVFMNVFDVHVNRSPIAGKIEKIDYIPGSFVNASFDAASEENERAVYSLKDESGRAFRIVQIAGLVARRIVAYKTLGDRVAQGERIGMIRFGSRVDCYLPLGYQAQVSVGERVLAGATVLGRIPAEAGSDDTQE